MRGLKRSPWLFGLGVLLAVLVVYGGYARAEVTTDQSASMIIFPKVIVDGTRDTYIQIANTDNMAANAECVYTNTAGTCSVTTTQTCRINSDCPTGPPAEVCLHQCTQTNFTIFLTGQQPTFWGAAEGRSNFDVYPGFSPGLVKPLATCIGGATNGNPCAFDDDCDGGTCSSGPDPFIGELKCFTIDQSGVPIAQNSLKGEAIIFGGPGGGAQLSEYNAIGIQARVAPVGNTIVLDQLPGVCDGGDNDGKACFVNVECPGGGTCAQAPDTGYNACPLALYMNHSGEGAVDSFTEGTVNSELSLVPCSELLEQEPVLTGAHFDITTEMEQSTSCSVQFECGLNARLSDLAANGCNFGVGQLGGENLKTKIRPTEGKMCYSGSARCHICTRSDDIDCIDQSKALGEIAGNCDCDNDGDCPGYVMATGSGACTLSSSTSCTQDSDCNSNGGCNPGPCVCASGDCVLFPPAACTTTSDCVTGQTCTGAVSLGCRQYPGLLGVAEEFQTGAGAPGTAAVNLHMQGSRPGDVIVVTPAD
jgi:hypothetical protein